MSPIRRLLAAACADRPIGEALPGLDRERVRRHLLAPLAHALGVPGFERDHLAASLLWERRRADTIEALGALTDAGITAMLIKGIAYAGRLYPDPATRPMSDVDLLVEPDVHAEAARVLGRLGYWFAGEALERTRFHHAITLKRRGGAIDLHRSIVQPLRAGARIPGLWRRSRPAPLAGARVPEPVDEALIGLAHIARHELWVPAINLVDGARLLARCEAGAILERAREVDLGRGVAAAIALIQEIDRPGPVLPSLMPGIDAILEGPRPGRAVQLVRKLLLTNSPGDALRLAANAVLEALGPLGDPN